MDEGKQQAAAAIDSYFDQLTEKKKPKAERYCLVCNL